MPPEKTTEQAVNEKVGIGAYLSLAFAVVFFSGLCASSQWWGVFDFTTVNGGFGRLVSGVTEQGDAIKTAMANFRGKGGSGAIDGAFQMTADAPITNFFSSGAVLFTLVAADGTLAVPVSLGLCLGVILLGKVLSANMMRLLQIRASRK